MDTPMGAPPGPGEEQFASEERLGHGPEDVGLEEEHREKSEDEGGDDAPCCPVW